MWRGWAWKDYLGTVKKRDTIYQEGHCVIRKRGYGFGRIEKGIYKACLEK